MTAAVVATDLEQFVQRVAAQHHLRGLRLVRDGWNAVFSTDNGVMLRAGTPAFAFDGEVQTAEVLREHGVATPRVLFREVLDHRCVTAVEQLTPVGTVDWRAVGELVARLHTIPVTALSVPSCTSFDHWRFDELLELARPAIDVEAYEALCECHERWRHWRDVATHNIVVCHGDVQPANVVPTATGPVLIDLDLRCTAPAAYDHAALLTWEHRWNGTPGTYAAFAAGYGQSFDTDEVGRQFAELRLLAATLMRLRAARTDPNAAAEATLRLRWWRGEPDAPRWTPQ